MTIVLCCAALWLAFYLGRAYQRHRYDQMGGDRVDTYRRENCLRLNPTAHTMSEGDCRICKGSTDACTVGGDR